MYIQFAVFAILVILAPWTDTFQFSDREYQAYNDALNLQLIDEDLYYGTFPEDFTWASATSAYQIEGAWNVSGKGESIWDRWVRNWEQTGDVACNSYYQYEDDIANLVYLGVQQYRFSIAWTRLQPTGEETVPNQAGIDYYNNLINGLIAARIEPVATLYHWDLPQALHEKGNVSGTGYGGWMNETLIVPAFANYARICFENFGDRVKTWITLNEPWIIAYLGYGNGVFAPGINGIGDIVYTVSRHLLLAHAEAYHVYDQEFRATQQGEIGITLNVAWSEPRNKSIASDVDAAMRDLEFQFGWFANSVFVNGDFPDIMKFKIGEKSSLQGLPASRLPPFSEAEKERIFGTSDFFGLNFYTSSYIYHEDKPLFPPSYDNDKGTAGASDDDWPTSGSNWLRMTPFGMRKILKYIDSKYGKPRILITENGISDRNDSLTDDHRIRYHRTYINNVLQAIDLDGVNVIGYTAWSLMDNFEWGVAYDENFGLYQVDFEDPARPRTVKQSAEWYKQMIIDNGFLE